MNVNEQVSVLKKRTVHTTTSDLRPYRSQALKARKPPSEPVKSTPLIAAALNGHLDCVKILLRYNADVEGRGDDHDVDVLSDQESYSPTFAAAAHGHVDVLSCLLENGADVNTRSTDNKFTPLMIASANDHVNAVTFLVEHGANMDL